jgi:hypothetical protein
VRESEEEKFTWTYLTARPPNVPGYKRTLTTVRRLSARAG